MGRVFIITEEQHKRLTESNFTFVSNSPFTLNNNHLETSVSSTETSNNTIEPSEPTTLDKVQKSKTKNRYLTTMFGCGNGLMSFGLW